MIKFEEKGEQFYIKRGGEDIMIAKKDDVFICSEEVNGNPPSSFIKIFNINDNNVIKINIKELKYSNMKEAILDISKIVFRSYIPNANCCNIETQTTYISVMNDYINLIGKKNDFIINSDKGRYFISNTKCSFKIELKGVDIKVLKDKMFQYNTVYSTNNFIIHDKDDPTKSITFDLSEIKPNTNRIIKPPSKDGKLLTMETIDGSVNFISSDNENSYKFNGIDEYLSLDVDVVKDVINKGEDFTVNLWVKFVKIRKNTEIISIGNSELRKEHFRIIYIEPNKGTLQAKYSNRVCSRRNVKSMLNKKWSMITFSSLNGRQSLYVNGILSMSLTTDWNNPVEPDTFNISKSFLHNHYAKNTLGELTVYNIGMDSSAVTDLWNGGIYKSPELSNLYQNCVLNIDANSEMMEENQPNGSNIINKVNGESIGKFIGISAKNIYSNYTNDNPNK